MINPSVRLRVWKSQLEANDFPAICVFSGEPADAWWKFRAHSTYMWATPILLLLLLLVVGFVVDGPLLYLLARRATGRLPVKSKYARRLSRVTWISAAVLGVAVLMFIAASSTHITGNVALDLLAAVALFTSLPVAIVGLAGVQLGLQLLWNPLAPQGRVLKRQPGDPDSIVVISNLHPAFVAAAQAMYSARSALPQNSK